jgi:hypothetical protein
MGSDVRFAPKPVGAPSQALSARAFCTIERAATRDYIEQAVRTQLAFTGDSKDVTIWTPYDLPWTHGTSADDVLKRALGFLEERCSK